MVIGWALQSPEQQQPVIRPLKTQCHTKLGSAEPRHLGYRGVNIKLACLGGGGGGCIATPLDDQSGSIKATRKRLKMTTLRYISGKGTGWALQSPKCRKPILQPLKTQWRRKLGSAEPRLLGTAITGWYTADWPVLGLNWSGVDPPLSSSRACLTTFLAFSVP